MKNVHEAALAWAREHSAEHYKKFGGNLSEAEFFRAMAQIFSSQGDPARATRFLQAAEAVECCQEARS